MAEPIFSPEIQRKNLTCLICSKEIFRKRRKIKLGASGWEKFKNDARNWSSLDIPINKSLYIYTEVFSKVQNATEPFGETHKDCRASFGTKYDVCLQTFGISTIAHDESIHEETEIDVTQASPVKCRLRYSSESEKEKCFICFEKTTDDSLPYKNGGLTRCCEDTSASRLLEKKKLYITEKSFEFYKAALRLDLQLKGDAFDVFSADIYYHKSCYLRFAHPYESLKADVDQTELLAMETFFHKIRIKILEEKCAFLLKELLNDLVATCEDLHLSNPVITNKRTLQRRLEKEFGTDISFDVKQFTMVYASDTKPCDYAVAALHGCGLRDDDFMS